MSNSVKKQPLYDQLVDLLKEKIKLEMKPNQILPSERELSTRYGLSRTTVRLALQELEKMGYIYRQHGKGTFVSDLSKQITNLSGAYSFTEQMLSLGRVPTTKVFEFSLLEANKFLGTQLQLSIGDPVFKLKRLRLSDGQPMMVERTYLPVKKFIHLTRDQVEEKPLYTIFEEDFKQTIQVAEEEFFASIARKKDADLLGILEGAPVLHLLRTTYNTKNEVIEYTKSIARADQYRYRITHRRRK